MNDKKIRLLRKSIVALIALIVLSAAFAGLTLSKHIAVADGGDTSSVADWGITVKTTGDLFGDVTKSGDGSYSAALNETTVLSIGMDDISGTVTLSGQAETAAAVSYDATLNLNEYWNVTERNGTEKIFYCPLVFTIEERTASDGTVSTVSINGKDYDTESDLAAAITDTFSEFGNNYAANAALDEKIVVTISWPSETKDDEAYYTNLLYDNADAGNAPDIEFIVDVNAKQID